MNWIKVAQLSVTVINEVIEIMKEKQNGGEEYENQSIHYKRC